MLIFHLDDAFVALRKQLESTVEFPIFSQKDEKSYVKATMGCFCHTWIQLDVI